MPSASERVANPLPYFANNAYFMPILGGALALVVLLVFCLVRVVGRLEAEGRRKRLEAAAAAAAATASAALDAAADDAALAGAGSPVAAVSAAEHAEKLDSGSDSQETGESGVGVDSEHGAAALPAGQPAEQPAAGVVRERRARRRREE